MYSIGDHIWIEHGTNEEYNIPYGCIITRIEKKKIQVQNDDGHMKWIDQNNIIKPMHTSSIGSIDNMINLGDLQEYAILRNLELRYKNKLIYTYIADMLVVVNPYQTLNIFSTNDILMYSEKKSESLSPHIFATCEKCFSAMTETKQNQCILISGESGAGKTECTKFILQYLTAVNTERHSRIKQQILEANPILEAFGNAKTQKNNNSSRFGKYINIYFNTNKEIQGAYIDYYLLEKTRIVSQSKDERNFHIFYALLAGLSNEDKEKYYLKNVTDYAYLTEKNWCTNNNYATTFTDIKASMQLLHYDEKTFSNIINLLSMILHLGNLNYKEINYAYTDATEINDDYCIQILSRFLGVTEIILTNALTKKKIFTKEEIIVSHLTKTQAHEVRDAFAKLIYERIFKKIVDDLNKILHNPKQHLKTTIGILDISGFENFNFNSFEQLCINYTNEILQQFFVHYIFKIEQERYISEGISWTTIEFDDNQKIINFIGITHLNIMSLIDEETIFPKGSDTTLLSKVSLIHGNNKNFIKPKCGLNKSFGIIHFAGTVDYNITGFLDKNRDVFLRDFKELIISSSNNFFKSLFSNNELRIYGKVQKRSRTSIMKFRESLEMLSNTLRSCNPFFIRCIKPNENQLPQIFDKICVNRQLRYTGLFNTVRIRNAGYDVHYNYVEFYVHFQVLAQEVEFIHKSDYRYIAEKICSKFLGQSNNNFQIGTSKIFLRGSQNKILECEKSKILEAHSIIIQQNIKMWIIRKRFLRMKKAAVLIQKTWRGYCTRKKFSLLCQGINRLQSRLKSKVFQAEFKKKRTIIILIQAACRRYLVQKFCEKKRKRVAINTILTQKNKDINVTREYCADHIHRQTNTEPQNNIDDIFYFLYNDESNILKNHIKIVDTSNNNLFRISNELIDAENISYDFYKFASIYFKSSSNTQFNKKPLTQSLLELPHLHDQMAARILSTTILQFMGDFPDPHNSFKSCNGKTSISSVNESLSKHLCKTDNHSYLIKQENQHFLKLMLKKKNKLNHIVSKGIINDGYKSWLNTKRSNLEKLYFITGHGIILPELKDEIYCQITKQLINNPSKTSRTKGWILLSLCLGCFTPSERLLNYFRSFIKNYANEYASFCEKRLVRTLVNGSRHHPPCWIEIQSVKYKQPISLKVFFANGKSKTVLADSASTAEEIVNELTSSINLKDTFGFSLYITIDEIILSLAGRDHVMDAISLCEQYAKEKGHLEHETLWQLVFRKEMFSPWHDATVDEVATDLIYHQICEGIKLGEYKCHNENDIAAIIAQQLFIHSQSESPPKGLQNIFSSYVPNQLLGENTRGKSLALDNLVIENYQKIAVNSNSIKTKMNIVSKAKNLWPLRFSKFFEAKNISGLDSDLPKIIIAINHSGIWFVSSQETILQQLSFFDIFEVTYQKTEDSNLQNLTIFTIKREELIFQCNYSENIAFLINDILNGLKQRSIYIVAIQDYLKNDESSLSMKKGDLIKLTQGCLGSTVLTSTWGTGEKDNIEGKFPCQYVYVLPILNEPPPKLLEPFMLNFSPKSGRIAKQELEQVLQEVKIYTLKTFANEHFIPSEKTWNSSYSPGESKNQNLSEKSKGFDYLWKHTREPIKTPLLAKLSNNKKRCQLAVQIFTNILKYMGDLPSNKQQTGDDLYTDKIFGPTLTDELLCDEIYCQIIRQLTANRIRLSKERGWELMWLATGIITCSPLVSKELEQFLKSSHNIIAKECLRRLNRKKNLDVIRMYPPNILEIEAIRSKTFNVLHEVYFPDDTNVTLEIDSTTTVHELCDEITKKLQLRSQDAFGLFFKIKEHIVSVPSNYFFFDFLQEIIGCTPYLKNHACNQAFQSKYQVLFMRKIWIDCCPGRDRNADSKFHFYQEVAKYLRGYHKCSLEEAVELAAFIYISGHGNNKEELLHIYQKLQEYVPAHMTSLTSAKDWKRRIVAAYNRFRGLRKDEAKERFLRVVYQWPTFGSVFFNVRQRSERSLPEDLVVGVNKSGVILVDPFTREILSMHGFGDITSWSCGNTNFQMTLGNSTKARNLLCETSFGYKLDELISSYIQYLKGGTGTRFTQGEKLASRIDKNKGCISEN